MEKKIEKLEGSYDVPQLKQKLNEIIDHLNSQDQEEEITAEQLCEDNRKRMERLINKELEERGFIRKIKDTPEEKEEWVEKLWELIDVYRDSKDINSELEGIEEVNQYVKQLLDEREREVLESMRDWVIEYYKDTRNIRDFDAEIAIGKIVDRELDKLNKKKVKQLHYHIEKTATYP